MLLRHAVPLNLKIKYQGILGSKIDYSSMEEAKKVLNSWFSKKLSELNKPIKSIEFIGADLDMGNGYGIGLAITLED